MNLVLKLISCYLRQRLQIGKPTSIIWGFVFVWNNISLVEKENLLKGLKNIKILRQELWITILTTKNQYKKLSPKTTIEKYYQNFVIRKCYWKYVIEKCYQKYVTIKLY